MANIPFLFSTTVKQGTPDDDELERLADDVTSSWEKLGRRLKVKEAQLKAFHQQNENVSEKAYKMLLHWKQRDGSAATYQVLHDALCHRFVNRRDLAEQYRCDGYQWFVNIFYSMEGYLHHTPEGGGGGGGGVLKGKRDREV